MNQQQPPFPLSMERQMSSIPKAGTDENWLYPSEKQFWGAMVNKGWSHEPDKLRDGDMSKIISMHNANNEAAWAEVMKWERTLHPWCDCPKLKTFYGDATRFTPKAILGNYLLARDLPFDRHDWLVDRCGWKDVRYVIDFYDDGSGVDPNTKTFARVDVRPAITDVGAVWDRAAMTYHRCKWRLFKWANVLQEEIEKLFEN